MMLTAFLYAKWQKRCLEMADLYEAPLTNFGADAVDRWFSEGEISEMLALAARLAV